MRRLAQAFGQVAYIDKMAASHHAGVSDDVFQLPNVTRPIVAIQQGLRSASNSANILAVLRGAAFHEFSQQQGKVLSPVRQDGKAKLHCSYAVIEILAELSCL